MARPFFLNNQMRPAWRQARSKLYKQQVSGGSGIMKNRLTLAALMVGIGLLIPAIGNAAKAPHMEKEVEGPVVFVRPELQDLGTTVTPIIKRIFYGTDFNYSDTTLTLDLVHHKGSAIMGTARFRAIDDNNDITLNFPVGGKTKLKKQKISTDSGTTKTIVPGFSLKGSALYQGTSVSLTLSAVQTAFDASELQTTSAISLADYAFIIQIKGLPQNYNYETDATVRGRFNFGFELAPDSVGGKKKPSTKFDYYYVWSAGVRNFEIGKGKFRNIDGDGIFTLKARKIKLTATDSDYTEPFDPEFIKLKTPVGKFTGNANEF